MALAGLVSEPLLASGAQTVPVAAGRRACGLAPDALRTRLMFVSVPAVSFSELAALSYDVVFVPTCKLLYVMVAPVPFRTAPVW